MTGLAPNRRETLTKAEVLAWAERHERARLDVRPFDPPSSVHPDMTLADAYRIQQAWIELQVKAGASIVGHKIGLTSRAMQRAMNIETPDSGYLLDYMVHASGVNLNRSSFVDPKIEVELAFVLGQDLYGPDLTIEDVLEATERIVPALELIDARSWRTHPTTGRTRLLVDTVSDNAADAGIILGHDSFGSDDLDLRWVSAICTRNGVVEETGVAGGVLNHPAVGIVWLAKRYAESMDDGLKAGEIILSGSFTRPLSCQPGDKFVVEYRGHGAEARVDLGSVDLGKIRCDFQGGPA